MPNPKPVPQIRLYGNADKDDSNTKTRESNKKESTARNL